MESVGGGDPCDRVDLPERLIAFADERMEGQEESCAAVMSCHYPTVQAVDGTAVCLQNSKVFPPGY